MEKSSCRHEAVLRPVTCSWHVTPFISGSFCGPSTHVSQIPLAILSVGYNDMIMHISIEIDSSALEERSIFNFSCLT
jgi:hypothetical protein